MHKLLLTTGGLLLALLVLIARPKCWRSGKAEPFGAHSHMAAHTAPPRHLLAARPGYILRPGGCERLTSVKAKKKRRTP